MYPILQNSLVRGESGDFFLQQYKTGTEYELTDIQAMLLHRCDGKHSLEMIAEIEGISQETIHEFLEHFESDGLLVFSKQAIPVNPPILVQSPFLQEVQIEGTGMCNLWCKHCYGRKVFDINSQKQMSTQEFVELCRQLEHANVGRAFLSGGEIMMRKDLPDLIGILASHRIHLSGIFTNGTMFREDVFTAMKESGMKTTLLVSVDGHTSAIHDHIRGVGNFVKTVRFIKQAIEYGHKVTVNTVATKQNIGHLLEMRNFFEVLGISRWRVSVQREQGEAIENKPDIEPTWEAVFAGYREMIDYVLKQPQRPPLVQLSSVFKTEFLQTGTYYLYRDSNSTCEYKRNSLVINPHGDVLPCPAGMGFILGNVFEEDILSIWRKRRTQAHKSLPINRTACRECGIRQYCGAGCRVIARQNAGTYYGVDENSCAMYRFFAEEIRPILSEVGVQGVFLKESSWYRFDEVSL